MTNKLTDAEIVKAVEYCSQQESNKNCKKCPIYKQCNEDPCYEEKLALDLINRLQAKNEELVGNVDKLKAELFDKTEQLNVELKAMRGAANSYKIENERLKTGFEKILVGVQETKELYVKDISKAKAEAVTEFAERLKTRFLNKNEVINNTINNLLKEMVGESGEG